MSNKLKFEQLPQYIPSKYINDISKDTVYDNIIYIQLPLDNLNINNKVNIIKKDISKDTVNNTPIIHPGLGDEKLYNKVNINKIILNDNVNK